MKQILFAKNWGTGAGNVSCVGSYEGEVKAISGNDAKNATAISFVDGNGHSIPFYKNGARVTVTEYSAGTKFLVDEEAIESLFPETIVEGTEYTLIFTKKGVPFNERNKWTWSYLAKPGDESDVLLANLIDFLLNNKESLGITADDEALSGVNVGDDYIIVATDGFGYHKIVSDDPVEKAVGDKAYILDLMSKCAADSGFEYPSVDTNTSKIYPGYGVIPIEGGEVGDGGPMEAYDIVNVFFAEPREAAKPLDTAINQVLHIVCPKNMGNNIAGKIKSIIDEQSYD